MAKNYSEDIRKSRDYSDDEFADMNSQQDENLGEFYSDDEIFECPECGCEIKIGDTVCKNCGTGIDWCTDEEDDDSIQCTVCGTLNLAGSSFCSNCGTKLVGIQEANSLTLRQDAEQRLTQNMDQDSMFSVRCPYCGEAIQFGVSECEHCGTELEWKSSEDMLISLDEFKEENIQEVSFKEKVPVDYGNVTIRFDTFRHNLQEKAVRLDLPDTYPAPKMEYNSYGIYSK